LQEIPLKCLYAASEVAGFAKTGGLADVAGSLPQALAKQGIDCAVIMPLYRSCRQGKNPPTPTDLTLRVPMGGRTLGARLWKTTLPDSDVPLYLIEHNDFFDRDDAGQGRGIYQFTNDAGQKADYPDNSLRFGF